MNPIKPTEIDNLKNKVHIAEVIFRGTGIMKPGRLAVGSEGSEFHPEGWHDEIVAHTIRRNKDGTISAIVLINLYDNEGNVYSAERVVRLAKNP